jgi:signal peptidase I
LSLEPSKAHKASAGGWKESAKIIVHALILAMIVRVFFYQPFNIPSGSMKSTLLVGDYLFVSKLSYGYSRHSFPFGLLPFSGRIWSAEPKRGDVVVFKLPRDNATDYIKRIVGLPGDTIEMRAGQLVINGQPVPKRQIDIFETVEDDGRLRRLPRYEETLPEGRTYRVLDSEPNGLYDTMPPYRVPAGYYFMMGDNRDNSTDSRARNAVGPVPFENIVGRAEILFFSVDVEDPAAFSLFKPWTWPFAIRWSRFFSLIR